MSQYIFEGKYQDNTSTVKVRLLLINFQDENKVHFVYSPHLDLTGYGNNLSEAKESFEIAFEDFIDYTIKKKTLTKVLTNLGWKTKGTEKHPKKVIAPGIAAVINDNDYVSEIFDKYPVKTYHKQVEIPVCA
jgi:hypothetical protein